MFHNQSKTRFWSQRKMSISTKDTKILWANSAGRCAFPNCGIRLTVDGDEDEASHTLGEMAHICREKPGANRYDAVQSVSERDSYKNRILLCPNHHTMIDKPENELKYSVAWLHKAKLDHEEAINGRLNCQRHNSRYSAAKAISDLLAENAATWAFYGPGGEIARKRPNDEEAYGIWLANRAGVIVPNNRQIIGILNHSRDCFQPSDFAAIALFRLHAESYESWVESEREYQNVKRFPVEFEKLMKEIANAGIQ